MFDLLKWKNNFLACDIYLALRPIFLFCKYFGTYVYSHSKFNKYLILGYTLILVLITTVSSAYAVLFIDSAEAEWYQNLVYFYLDKSQISLGFICCIITISNHVLKQEKLGKQLLYIDNVDNFLKGQNLKFIYFIGNHVWIGLMLIFTVIATTFIDYGLYTNSGTFYAKVQLISLYIPILVMHSSIAQWYSIVKLIGDHFVYMTLNALSNPDPRRLSIFIKVHGRLCTISRRINDLFGPCIFIWIFYTFVMMTEHLFISMRQAFQDSHNYVYSVVLITFLLGRFISLWAIVSPCDRTSTEADVFTTTLCKLMIEDKTGRISQKEVFHLHVSMKNTLLFTACSYFQINYRLIQAMVAGCVTLLVILIQFDMSQNSDTNQVNATCLIQNGSE